MTPGIKAKGPDRMSLLSIKNPAGFIALVAGALTAAGVIGFFGNRTPTPEEQRFAQDVAQIQTAYYGSDAPGAPTRHEMRTASGRLVWLSGEPDATGKVILHAHVEQMSSSECDVLVNRKLPGAVVEMINGDRAGSCKAQGNTVVLKLL